MFATMAAHAQCNQQPPQNKRSFPPNTTIYYQIDPNANFPAPQGTDPSPQTQIANAFDAWSKANSQSGGDGITFQPADATHPATVTIATDPSTTGTNAAVTSSHAGVLGASNPATITFYPNLPLPNGGPTFDPSQSGYGTVYLQDALHEIGHLQGIGDYNPPSSAPAPGPNSSVVIGHIGTNDVGNTSPKIGPTDCDRQQAAATSVAVAGTIVSSSGGGGGGGGTDDTDDGSVTYSYYDPNTGLIIDVEIVTVNVLNPDGSIASTTESWTTYYGDGTSSSASFTFTSSDSSSSSDSSDGSGGDSASGGTGTGDGSGGSSGTGDGSGGSSGTGTGDGSGGGGGGDDSCDYSVDPCTCSYY